MAAPTDLLQAKVNMFKLMDFIKEDWIAGTVKSTFVETSGWTEADLEDIKLELDQAANDIYEQVKSIMQKAGKI